MLETEDTEPISLPSGNWVPFEMLIFIQLIKIFCCTEWNTKLYAFLQKSAIAPIVRQINPVQKLPYNFSKIRCNIILQPRPRSSPLPLSLKVFLPKFRANFFSVPHVSLFFILVFRTLKNIRRASFPHLQRSSKGQTLCSSVYGPLK